MLYISYNIHVMHLYGELGILHYENRLCKDGGVKMEVLSAVMSANYCASQTELRATYCLLLLFILLASQR